MQSKGVKRTLFIMIQNITTVQLITRKETVGATNNTLNKWRLWIEYKTNILNVWFRLFIRYKRVYIRSSDDICFFFSALTVFL